MQLRLLGPLAICAALTLGCAPEWTEKLNEGGAALSAGRNYDALRAYDDLAAMAPSRPEGPYGRGLALRALDRKGEA